MKRAEIRPLESLEQVLDWQPDPELKFQTAKMIPRNRVSEGPKLLVCHDMQGGYLEDRFVEGSERCDSYRFFHWNYVDTFIYFSHHLVTIPPVGWINAGHRHGVKVLGTIITEWDQGKETCDNLLSCSEKCSSFVRQLVAITKHFGFDGWLVNIENELQEDLVPKMAKLVQSLKTSLEDSVPGCLVIWYDSVINSGKLKWQNELNENNRLFFDVCDGIFLNYNWTEETLEKSQTLAGPTRLQDVYVGVDVFGRGCLGGGGFNTAEAVEVANRLGLSVALFAPGWVMEVHGWDSFLENQYKFWNLIGKYFRSSRHSQLPIVTSFCQGFGLKSFENGECVRDSPWYDLSAQQLQPTFESRQEAGRCEAVICADDAFNGGGCLKVMGTLTPLVPVQELKLMETYIDVVASWLVSLTWKALPGAESNFALSLNFKGSQDGHFVLLLPCSSDRQDSVCNTEHLLAPLTEEQAEKLGLDLCADRCSSWTTRLFLLEKKVYANHTLTGIGIRVSCGNLPSDKPQPVSVLLGELQVKVLPEPKTVERS